MWSAVWCGAKPHCIRKSVQRFFLFVPKTCVKAWIKWISLFINSAVFTIRQKSGFLNVCALTVCESTAFQSAIVPMGASCCFYISDLQKSDTEFGFIKVQLPILRLDQWQVLVRITVNLSKQVKSWPHFSNIFMLICPEPCAVTYTLSAASQQLPQNLLLISDSKITISSCSGTTGVLFCTADPIKSFNPQLAFSAGEKDWVHKILANLPSYWSLYRFAIIMLNHFIKRKPSGYPRQFFSSFSYFVWSLKFCQKWNKVQ